MPFPKPTVKTNWAVGNPDFNNRVVEPSVAKKQAAWLDGEQPPAPIFNFLFNAIHQWQEYFENVTDEIETRYDAIVGTGPGATHATLALAIADVALTANSWIKIISDQTVETAISLTKPGWRIDFKPGVVFTKGAGAPTSCLILAAEGIEIYWGRLVGWTAGGDKAITHTVDGNYTKVIGTRFGPGTTEEVNQDNVVAGKKGVVAQTITEV